MVKIVATREYFSLIFNIEKEVKGTAK